MKSRRKRTEAPELVETLVDIGVKHLAKLSLGEERTRSLMHEIAHELCDRYKRQIVYVPQDIDFVLAKRNRQIWERFDGTNILELASDYDMSEVQIYKIIAKQREMQKKKEQPTLPGFDS
jgi:Mor family transcriptional regulator